MSKRSATVLVILILSVAVNSAHAASWKCVVKGAAVGLTAAIVAPVAASAAGFGATGIAAGSVAAKVMSVAALANGGGVAASGVVATLQSMGAAGLTLKTAWAGAYLGGSVGSWFCDMVEDMDIE